MKKLAFFIIIIFTLNIISILSAECIWKDDFKKIQNWYDNKTDSSFNAVIVPGKKKGTADVIQKGKGNWGKVAFVVKDVDLDKYKILKTDIKKVSKNGDYKILITSLSWKESFTIIDRGQGKGVKEGDITEITGWKGKKSFNVVIVIEGTRKKVTLNSIEISTPEEE